MKTYSIAAAELKKIIELVNTGYQCTEFSDDETLYIRLEKIRRRTNLSLFGVNFINIS